MSGPSPALAARALLVDSVRRRRGSFVRLAIWSLPEALPAFLSGLLVSRALTAFVTSDVAVGLGWLAVYAGSVLVGVWGTRQTLNLLAGVVEPFRDELVTGVVSGAVRRAVAVGRPGRSGDVAVLTEQVEIVREAYAAVLMVTQQFAVVSIAALLGLLALSPLAIVFVAPPLLLAVAVFVLALRRMADQQRASIGSDERLAEDMTIVAGGLRDIVAGGGEEVVGAELAGHVGAHAKATAALGKLAAVGTLAVAIGSWVPLLLVLGFGPWLVDHGSSVGVIVGVSTYVLFSLQPALQTLVHGLSGPGLWLSVTLRRVVERLDQPEPESHLRIASTGRHQAEELSLRGVSFAYSDWAAPVVTDLDLVVPSDDHLAIVGPSGIGKSTLAGLMTGLLRPQHGEVRIGAIDVGSLLPQQLAERRVLIPQEAYVFDATVRQNLAYLSPDVSDRQLETAVDRLGGRELLARLGGYDATLDPGALSAGERQLLTLVRAFVSPAPLVILDEATCHLDPAAEAVVERAFAERPGALVVIAHRMSSALRARRILLLDGTTVLIGSNAELLERSALYRDLVGYWRG